jgi:ribosomal protein L7/L12
MEVSEKIKVVATDVDGTLTDKSYRISLKAIQIIRELEDSGIKVILISSRDFPGVMELAELVKEIKDKFGVTGMVAAPVGVAAAPGAAPQQAEAEEKTSFDVVLVEVPADKKIKVLKEVRTLTGLGLKEAKALIESLPKQDLCHLRLLCMELMVQNRHRLTNNLLHWQLPYCRQIIE